MSFSLEELKALAQQARAEAIEAQQRRYQMETKYLAPLEERFREEARGLTPKERSLYRQVLNEYAAQDNAFLLD